MVRIHIHFRGGEESTFSVSPEFGWRLSYGDRYMIIKTGLAIGDRIVVPFDNVLYWRVDTTERVS
jgi:hypothetical protein